MVRGRSFKPVPLSSLHRAPPSVCSAPDVSRGDSIPLSPSSSLASWPERTLRPISNTVGWRSIPTDGTRRTSGSIVETTILPAVSEIHLSVPPHGTMRRLSTMGIGRRFPCLSSQYTEHESWAWAAVCILSCQHRASLDKARHVDLCSRSRRAQ